MAQNYNLATLGQILTVNTVSNTAVFANAVSVGNSTVNVSINSTAFTGTTNNTSYVGSVTAANVVSNAQLSANLANYTTTAGLSSYQTTAGLNANIAAYLPTYSGIVNGSTISVGTYFIANDSQLTIGTGIELSSNGSVGSAGQVLTSNGALGSPYWSTISGVNVAAQYAWTNTHSFSKVVTYTANVSVNGAIIANGGAGTSGQVLTSSAGGNVYWSTISGGGSVDTTAQYNWTNTQTFSNTVTLVSSLIANGSAGSSGLVLTSNGSTGSLYWSSVSGGGGGGGISVTVSNTLPVSRAVGSLWFNSDYGNLKVFYFSNGYYAWVDANLGGNPTYNVVQNKQAIAFSLVFGGF